MIKWFLISSAPSRIHYWDSSRVHWHVSFNTGTPHKTARKQGRAGIERRKPARRWEGRGGGPRHSSGPVISCNASIAITGITRWSTGWRKIMVSNRGRRWTDRTAEIFPFYALISWTGKTKSPACITHCHIPARINYKRFKKCPDSTQRSKKSSSKTIAVTGRGRPTRMFPVRGEHHLHIKKCSYPRNKPWRPIRVSYEVRIRYEKVWLYP
jgi:hypothetical protein